MSGVQTGANVAVLPQVAEQLIAAERLNEILVVKGSEGLSAFRAALDDLAAHAVDACPQFEGGTLNSALKYLGGDQVRTVLVWKQGAGGRQLIGAFPYKARRFYLGLPVTIWNVWEHLHTYLATPLVRAGYEQEAIRRFLAHADEAGAKLVRFPLLQAGGAFDTALGNVIAEKKRVVAETDRHERAFLQSDLDAEAYLSLHMRKKKRKEYNRLWNRLVDEGEVALSVDEGDAGAWLSDFLALERSGWKGKRGTALAEQAHERAFFEEIFRDAQERGKLHRLAITLNGKPIAMLASFIAGRGAFSFKIAYDESHARFSPGALLMLKAIGVFLADKRIDWVDSCAIPNHPMIDHIWAERRAIRELNISTAHVASPLLVAYSARASKLFDKAWAFARSIYHRIRKEAERDQTDRD